MRDRNIEMNVYLRDKVLLTIEGLIPYLYDHLKGYLTISSKNSTFRKHPKFAPEGENTMTPVTLHLY